MDVQRIEELQHIVRHVVEAVGQLDLAAARHCASERPQILRLGRGEGFRQPRVAIVESNDPQAAAKQLFDQ